MLGIGNPEPLHIRIIPRFFDIMNQFTNEQYYTMKITDHVREPIQQGVNNHIGTTQGPKTHIHDQESHSQSMQNCFHQIIEFGGLEGLPRQGSGPRYIRQTTQQWLAHGNRITFFKKGNKLDCVALVAATVASTSEDLNALISFEIIKTPPTLMGSWFIVVNREGPLHSGPKHWGENCFCSELWWQNNYNYGVCPGTFWSTDANHPMYKYLQIRSKSLSVEASFQCKYGRLIGWDMLTASRERARLQQPHRWMQ